MEQKKPQEHSPQARSENLQFHLIEPQVKEYKNIEYYFIALGLLVIGVCSFIGIAQYGENIGFNLMLITGALCILLGASNVVLEYAVRLAKSLGVSELVIGLTLISLGTSIPEIFTSITSAQSGVGGLSVGNIFGSYIAQLTLFLGIVIILAPQTVKKSFLPHRKRDAGLMILALIILSVIIFDGKFTRFEAIIAIGIFTTYTVYLYVNARRNPEEQAERIYTIHELEEDLGIHLDQENQSSPDIHNFFQDNPQKLPETKKPSPAQIILYISLILGGIGLTYFGAQFVVLGSVNLAKTFKVSEHVIGATIIGLGTAIPELTVSVMAIRKNKPDIAYGNLLGSNIVDPLFSGPIGALFYPYIMDAKSVDNLVYIALPIALFIGLYIIAIFSRTETKRWQGIMFGVFLMLIYVFFFFMSFAYG